MIDFEALVANSMVEAKDLDLLAFADGAEAVWAKLVAAGLKDAPRQAENLADHSAALGRV